MGDATPERGSAATGRVLIVEPNLAGNAGHHHTQLQMLAKLLQPLRTCALTNAPASASSEDLAAIGEAWRSRWKRRWPTRGVELLNWALEGLGRRSTGSVGRFSYGPELLDAIARMKLSAADNVVIPSADLPAIAAAGFCRDRLAERAPRFHLRFLTREAGTAIVRELRRRRLPRSSDNAGQHRLLLYCETEEMAAELCASSGADVHVTGGCYLPVSIMPDDGTPSVRIGATPDVMRIGVFGWPKKRKGSARLAGIIRAVSELTDGQHAIELVIQARDRDLGKKGLYAELRPGEIRGRGPDGNVRLAVLPDQLAPDAFEAAFRSVDALLLPYDVAEYGTQGSGLVQDAVSARKVIIHTAGMSMRSLLSHGNAIAATSDRDFAEAILRCAATLPSFAPALDAALEHYRQMLADHPLRRAMGLPRRDWSRDWSARKP